MQLADSLSDISKAVNRAREASARRGEARRGKASALSLPAYRAIDPADGLSFRWRDSRPYYERRIPVCMCDDDDDRAAGTAEVTRGGGGCSSGTTKRWYLGLQEDAASEGGRKIARRNGGIVRPRVLAPGGLAVLGPMEHDGLTTRVVMPRVFGTLASRSRPLLTALTMLLVALLSCCARASEFPERECCDLIFPIPEPTGRSTSAPTPTGRSGELFEESKL